MGYFEQRKIKSLEEKLCEAQCTIQKLNRTISDDKSTIEMLKCSPPRGYPYEVYKRQFDDLQSRLYEAEKTAREWREKSYENYNIVERLEEENKKLQKLILRTEGLAQLDFQHMNDEDFESLFKLSEDDRKAIYMKVAEYREGHQDAAIYIKNGAIIISEEL